MKVLWTIQSFSNKNEILNQTISKVQLSFHDVTNAVNFFISEESEKLTNQVLCLGGV